MKKLYFFLIPIFLLTGYSAISQCNFTSSFGSATINPAGAVATISTCSFAGEYSTINGAVNGQTLRFTSSVATDFITIRSGTSNGPVVASGVTPLVFSNTFTGTLFAHWATSAACGTQNTCRTTTVQCTNCSVSAPPNDLCTGALPIACAGTVTGTTVGATLDAVGTCGTALNTAPGVWYTFVGNGQSTTLSLCTGTSYDSKIGVFTGTCAALVCVTGNDDFCGLQSSVTFPTTLGTTYYVLVTGFGTASGAFTLNMTCVPPIANDICTGAITIGCGQTITGTTATATLEPGVPTCVTTLNTAKSLWYTFVGNGATNTLSMCGSGYDTKIGVFTGTCAALVCVTGNDDFCGLQSQVTFPTTLGTTYYIIVTGFGTASGAFTLTRTSAALPNDVCTGAITINCGQTLTGTTACGSTPDVVPTPCGTTLGSANGVWYRFVGDGSGVTMSLCGSSYDTKIGVFTGTCAALVCVTGNDDFCGLQSQVTFNTNAGFTYYVLVTGFGTSNGNFTLTRTCAPACTGVPSPGSVTPATSTVCVGSSVTLTCSGYPNNTGLTFQWNSAPAAAGPYTAISGATSNVYTFNAPTATTYYTCTVTCTSGGGGSSTTAPPVVVNVSNMVHSNIVTNPNPVCSVGPLTVSATVSGGLNLGNYTHTLTGPGTISAPVVSGPNNSNVSFTVTNMTAGSQTFILTSSDPLGCSKATNIPVTVNQTPVVTLSPASSTICNGAIVPITGTVTTGAGTVVYSPVTELFTDAGATTAYTGTALASGTIIYAKPTVTRTYTATVTSAQGCSSTTPITITVNQLPAITTQPAALAAPICPGFNVNYSVTATGTGITYQWQVSTDNGSTWTNMVNGVQYSNVTTQTVTILNVQTSQNGHRFRVIVSGVCPPAVTSSTVTLVVSTPPTITTPPASRTVCAPDAATFSVVAAGVPAPTIYQWQVSTNSGSTWTNLTTGGSYTPTLTVSPTATTQNGSLYRVIVTNSCGQSITSSNATLTVNARTPISIAPLPTRICISDTLVPLSAGPTGGSWSGIGVSGFNFVPGATAIGNYTLTYTYTNTLACTSTATVVASVVDCPERIRLLRDNAVIVYPNPNNGRFNFRMNSVLYNYLGMNVYNTAGQMLYQKVFSGLVYGRTIPIDLTFLPNGNYMVKFFYDDGIRTSEKTFPVIIGR
jgi:hypothetical protein